MTSCNALFACKISKREAANQALQLLQNIALGTSDSEYLNFEFDVASSAVANLGMTRILRIHRAIMQKRKATTGTDCGTRAPHDRNDE